MLKSTAVSAPTCRRTGQDREGGGACREELADALVLPTAGHRKDPAVDDDPSVGDDAKGAETVDADPTPRAFLTLRVLPFGVVSP